jgi:hypothetical protein
MVVDRPPLVTKIEAMSASDDTTDLVSDDCSTINSSSEPHSPPINRTWGFPSLSSLIFHIGLCWQLFVKLVYALTRGTRTWVLVLLQLVAFTTILMPGWTHMLVYYFFSKRVIKNVSYGLGAGSRNLLDVYMPPERPKTKAPVIVFVSGGAWIIGYKLWSCLAARAFSLLGCVVIVPDYRNFPQVIVIHSSSVHTMLDSLLTFYRIFRVRSRR